MSIHTRIRAALLAVAMTSLACGSGESAPEGTYALDEDAFIEAAVEAMLEHGRIPAGSEDAARGLLRQVEMDLELRDGGEFRCTQKAPGERHVYTGRWYLSGRQIRIEQTHEDGREVADSMAGTLQGGVLDLRHDDQGMEMRYVLRKRDDTPAAPR